MRYFLALACATVPVSLFATPVSVGPVPGINPADFRITTFASGLPYTTAVASAPGGGVLVASGFANATVRRLTDANSDGVADSAGASVIQLASGLSITSMVSVGDLVAIGIRGEGVRLFAPTSNPDAPYTYLGNIGIAYGQDWLHDTPGLALRPSSGSPGSYDLFFSIGSSANAGPSPSTSVNGLVNGTVAGASIYSVQVSLAGSTLSAGSLTQVASGLRNAVGMGIHTATGNLYLADNGIDGFTNPDEPESADELNVITSASLGAGVVDFGFSTNNYTQYRTGAIIGGAGTQPLAAFQPIAGSESEGPIGFAFSPSAFPGVVSNGVFISFFGRGGSTGGIDNEENPVLYYDFTTGQYSQFIANSDPGVHYPTGLFSSNDSLFLADLAFGGGSVFQITAVQQAPEPSTLVLAIFAGAAAWRFRHRARR